MALNVPLKLAIIASRKRQQRIAKLARIEPPQLSHIVNGRRPPTKKQRERLSKVLAKPETELFPDQVAS